MQFDPIRYQHNFDISLITTMGIVAREVEASQMTQLMGMMPQDFHQAQLVLAKGIIDHTSISNKDEVMAVIDKIVNPPPPTPQQQQQLQKQQQLTEEAQHAALQKVMIENQKLLAEIKNILAQADMHSHTAVVNAARVQQDNQRIQIEKLEQDQFAQQNRIALMRLPIERMKAEASMISAHANQHKAHNPPARAAA
jgi:hypothetical protein